MAKRITIGDRSYFLPDDTDIQETVDAIKTAMDAGTSFTCRVIDSSSNILVLVVSTRALDLVELDTDADAKGQISL
ncbi:hypothetical protein FXF50_04520 [Micromonospora sp. AP08]|uniref:hypothetical protein n=1 Tax=Micromonospora sp. AP08 TaxID=2604467 RepID=UPI0011D6DB42|nr:hypothetical protein [Micromonospora sp. AP08]TYB39651.1 hypothetical protein FXF50_04520 [Micromonospora sp. AP08]